MRPIDNPLQLRSQFALPRDKIIALYAGNIGSKQGLEIVVEAARQSTQEQNILWVICGHGAAHAQLSRAVEGMTNVKLLPVQPMEKFNQLLNCADIHLLPQRADAADLVMPSKLTGMLASGRPAVASANPATQIADVLAGKGVIVPPGDASAFRTAVQILAEDKEQRLNLGRSARRYAVERLSKRAVLSEFAHELDQLIGVDRHRAAVAPIHASDPACETTDSELSNPELQTL